MPLFIHDESDLASFRMITAQFVVNGCATQAQIARAFGVAKISIKRAVKRYREQGPKGFYVAKRARGPAVLTVSVLEQAQRLFDEQLPIAEVAERLGIKRDTLSKAVRAGRLQVRARVKSALACSALPALDACSPRAGRHTLR
jgi:transposase-like protein